MSKDKKIEIQDSIEYTPTEITFDNNIMLKDIIIKSTLNAIEHAIKFNLDIVTINVIKPNIEVKMLKSNFKQCLEYILKNSLSNEEFEVSAIANKLLEKI